MLLELIVENYAVVERVRIRFHAGLNTLTGETGSGKSIVIGALGLLFGGRASADMVRSNADRSRISGIFEMPGGAVPLLEQAGIAVEDEELLVEREVLANGKSRAFLANRPVTAGLLRDLAPLLGDIHGQHEQQRLFGAEAQREILDEFAGTGPVLTELGDTYREWKSRGVELAELERNGQERLRLLDLWTFQRNEIEGVALKPGEEEALENERRVLQNVTRVLEAASGAYSALYDDPDSAYAQVRVALKRLDELTRIDGTMREAGEILRPAEIAVSESASALRDYLGRIEGDPDRLEEVETRLAQIDKLKRKYGSTGSEILSFLENVRSSIAEAETGTERRTELVAKQKRLAAEYESQAERLRLQRKIGAKKLQNQLAEELKTLAMKGTAIVIQVNPSDWTVAGADQVAFMVSANVGEEPRPLEKVVSGGELSRIALALKTLLINTYRAVGQIARTLVFDEVDAGIGGGAAEMVGRRLKQISAKDQILCVTHLAQIAGYGDRHFAVEKRVTQGRTHATVEELVGEARTREIGRMLSGQDLTPEALKHAEQLIRK